MNLNLPVSAGTLFLYYGIVILSLIVVYITGRLMKYYLFRIKDNISALSILTCSILGLTSIITVYSIVLTKGHTANWMILFLFLIYIYYNRKSKTESKTQSHPSSIWKYILIICIINGIFFCYFIYRIIDFKHGTFQPYFCDFNYYAKLSQYLNLGYENGLLEYNFFKYITPRPYHYFELWVNAIMYKVFGLNSLVVYTVSLPMFFNTLLFIAFLAIVELRKKITIGYILLAFTILLLSDVIIYISEIFPLFKGWMPLLESPKLLPVFLFLFTAIVLFLYNQKQNAYYALIIIPVLNMISLVAIWGTTGLFLLVDTIKKRKINWNYWIPFAAIVFFYFIYLIQGDSRSSAGGEDFHWGLFRLYITQPIVYTMAYIHIIALILLLDRKKVWGSIKKIRIVVPIAFFIPMTVSIFMRSYNYDATQFVTGIIPVMVYAAVVMTFLMIITSIQLTPSKKGLIIFFCGISLLMSADAYKRYIRKNTWAFEYESAILKQLPPSKEYRIGFYIGGNVTVGKGNNYVSGIVDAVTIPDVLDYYYNNVYHYSINKGNNGAQYSTDHTPFRDYYEKIKKQLATISDDDIRINFMKENSIEYVRIFQSALPSDYFLSNLILLAEDRMSGERFYKVK